jgi:hypothetical protein
MQLVAYGAQDIYLTGNPQITFFKVVYRRHTNFSMESIEQTFNGSADFGKKVTCTISRNGDLIHRVYLQATLPRITLEGKTDRFRWLNWIGHVLVKNVEVEIGGQRIDKHYSDWLHIWNELTQTAEKQAGYANMVGNVPRLTQWVMGGGTAVPFNYPCDLNSCIPDYTLYIPLQFWFCRNPGLSLPLIALQYHEVKINIEFREARDCYAAVGQYESQIPSLRSASLYVDYIYLDTDERRRFAQVSHEYLIEQLQFTGEETVVSTSNKIKLNFNHPCKELVWVVQPDSNIQRSVGTSIQEGEVAKGGQQWFNYTDSYDYSYFTGTPESQYGSFDSDGWMDAWPILGNSGVVNSVSNRADGGVGGAGVGALGETLTNGGNSASVHIGDKNAWSNVSAYQAMFGPNSQVPASGWTAKNIPLFDAGANCVFSAKLQLNGHDRFSERDGRYFNYVQPYQHHTRIPSPGINVYSFGLKPEEHQPSGTCNMSRIDNATLQLTLTNDAVSCNRACKVKVYATNYNVLRIMSGMGGLAYSN